MTTYSNETLKKTASLCRFIGSNDIALMIAEYAHPHPHAVYCESIGIGFIDAIQLILSREAAPPGWSKVKYLPPIRGVFDVLGKIKRITNHRK